MNTAGSGNHRLLGRTAFSAGLNLALFAACAPALANGPFNQHGQWSHASAQSGGPSPTTFGGAGQLPTNLVHPHAVSSTVATSLSLNTAGQSQLPVHAFNPGHLTNFHNNLVRPTFQNISQAPLQVSGAAATGSDQVVRLDLTSSTASVVLDPSVLKGGASATISLDGVKTTFHTGDTVTPAELVAIYQSQGYGGQKILLDSQGRADGGTFSLNSVLSGTAPIHVSDVVVPQNVRAFDYVSSKSNITISGDLLNYGSIVDITRGNATANISATNIVNEAGGLITTVGRHAGVVDLNLNAANDFTNQGTITSSGGLNISAGGSIRNVGAVGGAAPVISAVNNISLQSTNIVNSGVISSSAGNVNFGTSGSGQDMTINNVGGTISALTGAINVRDAGYTGAGNVNLNGGDLLSKQVNLFSGGGTVNVDVKQLTGEVESSGNAVHVQASTENLVLGKQCLTGDPTFYNPIGNIILNGDITAAEDLTIIAAGDIIATNTPKNFAAPGFNITLIAGAAVSGAGGDSTTGIPTPGTKATGDVTVTGASSIGGNIDLTAATSLVELTTYKGGATPGGNITLAAFGSGTFNGKVLLPVNLIVDASAVDPANAGNVTILAGAKSSGPAIAVGTVVGLANANAGAKNLLIANVQPTVGSAPLVFNTNGSIKSGSLTPDYDNVGLGSVDVGSYSATTDVRLLAGENLTFGGQGASAGGNTLLSAHRDIVGLNNVFGTNIAMVSGRATNVNNTAIVTLSSSAAGNITIVGGAAFTDTFAAAVISGASGIANSKVDVSNATLLASSSGGNAGNITVASLTNAPSALLTGGLQANADAGAAKAVQGQIVFVTAEQGATTNFGTTVVSATGGAAGTGGVAYSATGFNTAGGNVTLGTDGTSSSNFLGGVAATGSAITYNLPSLNLGNLTIVQGSLYTISSPTFATGKVNALTIDAGGIIVNDNISAKSFALLSTADIQINTTKSFLNTGGIMLVAATDIVTTVSDATFGTNSNTTSGAITMVAGANFAFDGSNVTISGASATGGKIDLTTNPISGKITTQNIVGSKGGDVTLLAFSGTNNTGTIDIPVPITTASIAGGNNGNVTVIAGSASGTAVKLVDVDTSTDAASTPNPSPIGSITLQSAQPDTSTPLQFSVNGALTVGNPFDPSATGTSAAIKTGNLTAQGSSITVVSSADIQLGNLNASNPNGNGGSVDIKMASTLIGQPLQIGGVPTSKSFTGTIDTSGSATGSRGSISVFNNGTFATGIVLNAKDVLINNGAFGGNLSLATNGKLANNIVLGANNSFDYSGSVTNPQAGTISLIGWDVTYTGTLTLIANSGPAISGSSTAGSIVFQTSDSDNNTLNLTQSSTMAFSASGGLGDSAGGSVVIQHVGNIVWDPASKVINVAAGSGAASGNVGSVEIDAGYFNGAPAASANATLIVTGPINLSATGTGTNKGGSLTLQSNSSVPFNIGLVSGNLNGVQGAISLNGKNGGDNGQLTVVNNNGSVVTSVALTAFDKIAIQAEGAGNITVGGPLGSATTKSITLDAGNSIQGNITQTSNKAVITGQSVGLNGGKIGLVGGKNALAIVSNDVSAGSGGSVNITDAATGKIDLVGGGGGSYTFVAPAAGATINVNGSLNVLGAITLTAANINLSNDVSSFSTTQKTTLTATTGNITADPGTLITGGSVILSAAKGKVDVSDVGDALQSDSVTITALNSIHVNSVQALNNITMKTTATKGGGDITIDDEAFSFSASTGVATITATGNIVASNAEIKAAKQITISAKGGVDVDFMEGVSNISVSAGGAFNTNSGIETSGNITVKATDISYGDDLISHFLTSVISLTATAGDITATGSSTINAGKAVTLSATKGAINVDGLGGDPAAAPGVITLSAATGITMTDVVFALNSFTAKTTATTAGLGAIISAAPIFVTSPTGVVTISASGSGKGLAPAIDIQNPVEGGKSVTLSSKGDIHVNGIGVSITTPGAVTLTAGANIISDGEIRAVNSVTLKANGTGTDGNIILAGSVAALSANGAVSIVAAGTDSKTTQIAIASSSDVSAGKSVTITAAKGSVIMDSIGVVVPATKVVVSALNKIQTGTIQALSSVSLTTTSKSVPALTLPISTLGDVAALSPGGTVVITAANGDVTAGGDLSAGKSVTVSATTGNIIIGTVGQRATTGTLSVIAGGRITASADVNVVSNLSLLAKTTIAGDISDINGNLIVSNGSISIIAGGGGLDLSGNGLLAPISAISQSSKTKSTILIEASDKVNGNIIINNRNIATSGPGGGDINIAVGAPGKGVTSTPPSNITVNGNPANVFFGPSGAVANPPTKNVTVEGLNAKLIFSAPAGSTDVIKMDNVNILADPPNAPAAIQAVTSLSSLNVAAATLSTAPTLLESSPVTVNSRSFSDNVIALPALTAFNAATFAYPLQGSVSQAEGCYDSSAWISETEIDGGEIPVALHSDRTLALSGTRTANLEANHLSHGSVLSIPKVDTTIKTKHGDVSIAAGSMVVVMALENGLAVYNLDDTRNDAVVVRSGGAQMTVRPGTSLVVSDESTRSFAHVNPAQLVCYRRITEHALGQGLKAYRAEFALHTAIEAVKPLKSMLLSNHKETSRVANHFLKTLSIMMQLQSGGEGFKQVLRPQLTASAQL